MRRELRSVPSTDTQDRDRAEARAEMSRWLVEHQAEQERLLVERLAQARELAFGEPAP